MLDKRPWRRVIAWAAFLAPLAAAGRTPAAEAPAAAPVAVRATGVPYQIVLRSRSGEVVPERTKDGQTAGAHISVVQTRPDLVTFWMRGAVMAGAEQWKGGRAAMHFTLHQDFEIVPTRSGLRPPRLSLEGVLIGTLQSTPVKVGGSATQGPACASINSGDATLLHFCIPAHGVTSGERLFVNDEQGPFEMAVLPGGYCLNQTFDLSAEQPWHHCRHLGSGAGAFFDPTPRLEARWNYLLTPFRAVPSRDFGFAAVVRVTEEPAPPGAAGKEGTERLPAPKPVKPTQPPGEAEQP